MPKTVSTLALMRMAHDEDSAREFFINARWPDGLRCAFCNGDNVKEGKHPTQPYYCRDCQTNYSVKTNSVMSDSNLSYVKWLIAYHHFTVHPKGVSARQLVHDMEVEYKTAWHTEHRLREAMTDDGPLLFFGPVEVDETFIGGRKRNQNKKRRKELKMIPVIGMLDRATNRIRMKAITSRNSAEMKGFVYSNTAVHSEVHTDEASGYRGMFARVHHTINHKAGEYGPTNGIESVWSVIKRAYKGTYHKMSSWHLHRYLAEFTFRHDHRGEDEIDQIGAIVKGGVGKKLRLVELMGLRESGTRTKRRKDAKLDWFIVSAEVDILEGDLTRTEAISTAKKLVELRNEAISIQNVKTGEQIVAFPDGGTERHPPTA